MEIQTTRKQKATDAMLISIAVLMLITSISAFYFGIYLDNKYKTRLPGEGTQHDKQRTYNKVLPVLYGATGKISG